MECLLEMQPDSRPKGSVQCICVNNAYVMFMLLREIALIITIAFLK